MDDVIKQAIEHGSSIGQVSLANFILRDYPMTMVLDPRLKLFLEKVAANGYEEIAKDMERPAEDIALEVSQIMERKGATT